MARASIKTTQLVMDALPAVHIGPEPALPLLSVQESMKIAGNTLAVPRDLLIILTGQSYIYRVAKNDKAKHVYICASAE